MLLLLGTQPLLEFDDLRLEVCRERFEQLGFDFQAHLLDFFGGHLVRCVCRCGCMLHKLCDSLLHALDLLLFLLHVILKFVNCFLKALLFASLPLCELRDLRLQYANPCLLLAHFGNNLLSFGDLRL